MIQPNPQADDTMEPPADDYLPARMINEHVYCARLFYLMHVEGQFADSYDTVDGRIVHRRVDRGNGGLDAPLTGDGNIPATDLAPAPEVIEPEPKTRGKRPKHVQPATMFSDDFNDSTDSSPASDETNVEQTEEKDAPEASTIHARSVTLSSDTLGVIAKMDLIEVRGDEVAPVDYKRGKPKRRRDGTLDAWMPEKVQIALQAMLLRDHGYRCDHGVLYFNTTRQRVQVDLDDRLIEITRQAIQQARQIHASHQIPPPLVDSPKCAKCSMVNICLPDETRSLMRLRIQDVDETMLPLAPDQTKSDNKHLPVRPMVTARDERRPLYFNQQGLRVGRKDDVLIAKLDGKVVQEIRLREINQISLFGNVQLSTQAVQTMCHLEIPIAYFTQRGWFYGITHPLGVKNILVRQQQFRRADDSQFCLSLARQWVRSKIRNSRTLLMRNHRQPPSDCLRELKRAARRCERTESLASLLGIEGTAARIYFSQLSGMIKVDCDVETMPGSALSQRRPAFDFRGRNRRPPRDPVNALLSLAYSLLTKDCLIAATKVGLDPYLGFYHQIKPGKPALALDLMEPFRPLVAESVVITAINNRMVTPQHFIAAGKSVVLTDAGRKHFLMAYEQRMDSLVTHPLFDYRVSYRRLLEIQTRMLARYLTGEITEYPVFETR